MKISGTLKLDTGIDTYSLTLKDDGTYTIEPDTTPVDAGESRVFDCAAMASTLVVNDGDPVTAGDAPVPISIDNIGHDGKYQGAIDGGLKASIGNTPRFVGDSGGWPTNNYLWTPPDNLDKDTQVIFEYSGCTFPGPTVLAGGNAPSTPSSDDLPAGAGADYGPYAPVSTATPGTIPQEQWTMPSSLGGTTTLPSGLTLRRVANSRGPYSSHTVETGQMSNPIIQIASGKMIRRNGNVDLGGLNSNKRRPAWLEDDTIYYISNTQLRKFIYGGSDTLIHDFSSNGASGILDFGEAEGNFDWRQDKVLITEGSGSNVDHHSYSVSGGYLGKRTTAQILQDATNFRLNGAGLQDSVAGGRIDTAAFCKQGRYILCFVKNSSDVGVCYLRYDPDWSNPVILGSVQDGKFWKLRAQHKDFFIGLNGESMIMSDHWNKALVVDLDVPEVTYSVVCKGGGHYCGNAIMRPGHVLYSDNNGLGLIQMLKFDPADYIGSTLTTTSVEKEYIGYWYPPMRTTYRETWGFSDFGSSTPGTLAVCNVEGNRIYANAGDSDSQTFFSIYYP